MTQPDFFSALPAPASVPVITAPLLPSQPAQRPFYLRPLFLFLAAGLLALVGVVVLYGPIFGSSVKVSSPLHVGSPIHVTDSATAKAQAQWDALTPEQRMQACLVLNAVGINNAMDAPSDDGSIMTADEKAKAVSFFHSVC
jgi:hypothetical protein